MEWNFSELLRERVCPECGRIHRTDVKTVVMGEGILSKLPSVVDSMGSFHRIVMICDENTYPIAGAQVERLVAPTVICLDPHHLHADERGVETVAKQLPEDADLLLAVGSGTIHDITRYTAYQRGIPFLSVPTAASVDGYVSNVAAMTLCGTKKTISACAPIALVADIDIIAEAPMRLTASGVGDMLGKFTALADWKIAHTLTGEYLCPHVVALMEQALESVMSGLDGLRDRDRKAIASLIWGLVLSGIAMQHTGISRPASGAEHHISHYIEVTVPPEKCDALHGEKVGVGLVLVSRLYHAFAALSDGEIADRLADWRKPSAEEMRQMFGNLGEVLDRENTPDCAASVTRERLLSKLTDIRAIIHELPTESELHEILSRCGACHRLEDIGLSSEDMLPVLYERAPMIRNRLTLMRLLRRIHQ